MLMYGWMKFVEIAPERYDWAVEVMTGGRLSRIKDLIAERVNAGERILDVGCGTGTLAVRCMRRGAWVAGLDSSAFMLEQARKNAAAEGLEGSLETVQDSVTQLRRHFADSSFDVIVSTMALGEFPREYLHFVLTDCRRLLRPGGRLLIADETWPEHRAALVAYRVGLVLFWIPQFLLLRRAFFPIRDLRGVVEQAGFRVQEVRSFALSSFKLLFCERMPDALRVPMAGAEVPAATPSAEAGR